MHAGRGGAGGASAMRSMAERRTTTTTRQSNIQVTDRYNGHWFSQSMLAEDNLMGGRGEGVRANHDRFALRPIGHVRGQEGGVHHQHQAVGSSVWPCKQ